MSESFFEEQEEQSAVKTAIVTKYFKPWSTIMLKSVERIGYIDFYCGPGRFEDGSESTPLLILREAINDHNLGQKLVTIFTDKDPGFVSRLETEVTALPGIEMLRFKPDIGVQLIDDDYAKQFAAIKTIPMLSFIDPWGYKGLTRLLIGSVIKDFGCETVFFFNYSRINAAVNNNFVEPHVVALFGEERVFALRSEVSGLSPDAREKLVLQALGQTIQELGAIHLIPFRFKRPSGQVHYICYATKHVLGYTIMKGIMASLGIQDADGVPMFEYLPQGSQMAFNIDRPIQALADSLSASFRGRVLTVGEVIKEHNVGTPFIPPNYKAVLLQLEAVGRIDCSPPAADRRLLRGVRTLADHVKVTFAP